LKIAVDAMGGDRGVSVNVLGAIKALSPEGVGQVARKQPISIVLVGKKEVIKKELAKHGATTFPIEIKDASQAVEMDEDPLEACRNKPDSSIMVGVKMLKEKKIDGFVSAGNTGAYTAAATLTLNKIKKVKRPAIASLFPTVKDFCVITDVGANAECKPKFLYQFATMAEEYVKYVYKRRIPRVGLLSIGHEKSKGNKLVKDTYDLLMESDLNFIGNIEGGDIIKGVADVVVCDGFTGNIVLKFGESVAQAVIDILKDEIGQSVFRKVGAGMMKGSFQGLKDRMLYEEVGGAPLLGLDGTCIICHGDSNANAIKNAINVAVEFEEQGVIKHIEENIS
jgi:glycerol-3-phosphate acyltransferase PlsX